MDVEGIKELYVLSICSVFAFCKETQGYGIYIIVGKISLSHPLKGIHPSLQQYLLNCSVSQELYWILRIYVVYILT